jgi:hypothetical protein
MFSLHDKLDYLRKWYDSFADQDTNKVSFTMISKFIAKKGMVTDQESGYKHVAKIFKI